MVINSVQLQEDSVDEDLCGLGEVECRIGQYFARAEPRKRAMDYLAGLLSNVPRKNGTSIAAHAREISADGMQRLLTSAKWNVGGVRNELQRFVIESFNHEDSVLALVEAVFVKRGQHSAGVQRRYNETLHRTENCQLGLFLGYVSPRGSAFIDRELYVPDEWRKDISRCVKSGIPGSAFISRDGLAKRMLHRAFSARVPASWVTISGLADIGYQIHEWLARHRIDNVTEIRPGAQVKMAVGGRTVMVSAHDVGRLAPRIRWQHLATKDALWARVRLCPATDSPESSHWLLLRRKRGSRLSEYFMTYGPDSTSMVTFAQVATAGIAAREALNRAKERAGLDHYEARRYEAWYRHVTLALLADAIYEAGDREVASHEYPEIYSDGWCRR